MFWYFIDTAAYHDFGQYEPSFPSIKELHDQKMLTWMVVFAEVTVNLMTYFPFSEAGTQCIWPDE